MRRRQTWKIGDVFLVALKDDSHAVGQIVAQERAILNSVSCAFFATRAEENDFASMDPMPLEKLIAVLLVTRDLLDNGVWQVVAQRPVTLPRELLPYERLREAGFIGAKVRGSGIVNEFLNAFFGLSPWDDWHDPAYLDEFLISPDKKPDNLILRDRR